MELGAPIHEDLFDISGFSEEVQSFLLHLFNDPEVLSAQSLREQIHIVK